MGSLAREVHGQTPQACGKASDGPRDCTDVKREASKSTAALPTAIRQLGRAAVAEYSRRERTIVAGGAGSECAVGGSESVVGIGSSPSRG